MKGEVQKCLDAGLHQIHVDVFDGVYIDSPLALTFGPQMVECVAKQFANRRDDLILDIHLCVDRPQRYAKPMADAGATRIIFQWEAMADLGESALSSAIAFARTINSHGMKCGVSLNPDTPVASIYPLLETGLVDLVDVLAVEPGFGGQEFQEDVALQKIQTLRKFIDGDLKSKLSNDVEGGCNAVRILVDGGIHRGTTQLVKSAGADILVAGTALFRHPRGFKAAVQELL